MHDLGTVFDSDLLGAVGTTVQCDNDLHLIWKRSCCDLDGIQASGEEVFLVACRD
jgi:hypothetical protein